MAAIDKTYVNKQELLEAIEWCKKMGTVTLDCGYRFNPINFIYGYNDLDDPHYFDEEREEYVLWNTPQWFDMWLWNNCPLDFVRGRLECQYGEESLKEFENYKWEDPHNHLEFGHQHYTFLKTPKWRGCKWWMNNGRRKNPWPGKCKQQTYFIKIEAPGKNFRDDLRYCHQLNRWFREDSPLPGNDSFVWQEYHLNVPNKKSIVRQLRQWYIPKGYIVKVYQLRYVGMDFEILVK